MAQQRDQYCQANRKFPRSFACNDDRILTDTGISAAAACLAVPSARGARNEDQTAPFIATNVYPWMTFLRRNDREWSDDVDAGLQAVASTGVRGERAYCGDCQSSAQTGKLAEETRAHHADHLCE